MAAQLRQKGDAAAVEANRDAIARLTRARRFKRREQEAFLEAEAARQPV